MGNLFSYLFVEVKNGKRARVSIDSLRTVYYSRDVALIRLCWHLSPASL